MDKRQATRLYRSGLRRTVKTLLALSRNIRSLQKRVDRLERLLSEARRAAKRQAAPFSKGAPKNNPKTPGRRPGKAYGQAAHRAVPTHVDEVLQAPFPKQCPNCGEPVEPTQTVRQYQTDLPEVPKPHVTQFNLPVGQCARCGARVQGRHPRQTSNAIGAAASQLGPRALALAAQQTGGVNLFANTKYTVEKDLSSRLSVGYGIRFIPSSAVDPDIQQKKLDLISDVQLSYRWFRNVYLRGAFDLPTSNPGLIPERKVTIEPRWRFGWWGNTNKPKPKPTPPPPATP